MGKPSGQRQGFQSPVRSQTTCHSGATAQRRKMRLRLTGADGSDPVRPLLSHEDPVRFRTGGQPTGGQMDPLSVERIRQRPCRTAAACSHHPRWSAGAELCILRQMNAILSGGVSLRLKHQNFLIYHLRQKVRFSYGDLAVDTGSDFRDEVAE